MANILMWLPSVIKLCIEIYKLIMEIKKQGETVQSCEIAVSEARKNGDTSKLQEILERLKSGKSGC